MSFEGIESFIKKFPIYQYTFIKPDDIEYSDKVRQACKRMCRHYGQCWSCPPAVGKLEKCKQRCLQYSELLVFSTLTELTTGSSGEMAAAQAEHERLTEIICEHMKQQGCINYVITSSRCALCPKCTFPRDFCRYPEKMHPCIESHGIMISELADKCRMDYYMGSRLSLIFTLVYFTEVEVGDTNDC